MNAPYAQTPHAVRCVNDADSETIPGETNLDIIHRATSSNMRPYHGQSGQSRTKPFMFRFVGLLSRSQRQSITVKPLTEISIFEVTELTREQRVALHFLIPYSPKQGSRRDYGGAKTIGETNGFWLRCQPSGVSHLGLLNHGAYVAREKAQHPVCCYPHSKIIMIHCFWV